MDGKEIKAGQTLGYYLSTDSGLTITKLGTDKITNPNEKTKDDQPYISSQTTAEDTNGNRVNISGNLPNGVYALIPHISADNYYQETGLSEDVVTGTGWTKEKSGMTTLAEDSVVFLKLDDTYDPPHPDKTDTPETQTPTIPVAPDPVDTTPDDPYDPNNPDDPSDPDDSDDIPIPEIKWIDTHKYDYAYRIADLENANTTTGVLDVNDTMPTTFAFYVNRPAETEDMYKYTYNLSFYYEVANKGDSDVTVGGKYYKLFNTTKTSADDYLKNIVVLNEKSNGYISYSEIAENATVSGAIYNWRWLNEKLSDDGNYTILIGISVDVTYTPKFYGEEITLTGIKTEYGALNIKNRVLIPLD